MFQHPKCSKMVPLWYENHILAPCWPSEIVPKSMPKRLHNRLYLGYPLRTLKNTIFDVKTSPRWRPKISDFFQKSSKNATYHGLWSKMPLGSLQEPAKSLPGPSQEPFKGPQEAPCSLPKTVWEAPKRCPRAPHKLLEAPPWLTKTFLELQEVPKRPPRGPKRPPGPIWQPCCHHVGAILEPF